MTSLRALLSLAVHARACALLSCRRANVNHKRLRVTRQPRRLDARAANWPRRLFTGTQSSFSRAVMLCTVGPLRDSAQRMPRDSKLNTAAYTPLLLVF